MQGTNVRNGYEGVGEEIREIEGIETVIKVAKVKSVINCKRLHGKFKL